MLSVSRVSPGQALTYYTEDNYYTNNQGVESSEWWGKGASELGLSGKVSPKAFESLLAGKSPDGKDQLVNRASMAKSHKQRAGIDLTFSASKSVTLCSLNDERLLEAHKKAVNEALKVVENELSYVRLGKDRTVKVGGNLVVAQFHHDTSRKVAHHEHPDPQLHTHCVALNMVQVDDEKGGTRWLSLYNDGIFRNSKTMGMVYQNRLAKEVLKLGYNIEQNGNGTFEIAGFGREQLEAFSKRRKQIVELNARSKKEERSKMLSQRLSKGDPIPSKQLKKFWLSQLQELGINLPKPRSHISAEVSHRGEEHRYNEEAIKSAVAHFSERDVSFTDKKAISFAFENNIGRVSYAGLEAALEQCEDTVVHSSNYYGDVGYTTLSALVRDKQTVWRMKEGQGVFKSLASTEEVEAVIESVRGTKVVDGKTIDTTFTEGQEEAFRLVATTRDQIVGWQGVAGAGKSYAMRYFRDLAETKGYEVVGMAPDSSAAQSLAEGARLGSAKTIASFLGSELEDGDRGHQIWLVDEAGKVNAREMNALLERSKVERARVVLVGDTRQLSGVEAGNPFRLLQDSGMAVAHLTEHRRQKTEMLKKAVSDLSQGLISEGLSRIRSEVFEYSRDSTRINRITREYMSLSDNERQSTLVLAGTNRARKEILASIREKLKEEGKLEGSHKLKTLRAKDFTTESSRLAPQYAVGDILVPFEDKIRLGLKKDEHYQVVEVGKRSLKVRGLHSQVFSLDPSKVEHKSVFAQEVQEVAIGDKLKWTRNDHRQGRINGGNVVVTGINNGGITIRSFKDGKLGLEEQVNSSQRQYLDHALVSTAYGSQGKTSERVLLAGDSSIGRESMYVAISRAKQSVKIFVDSYVKMVKAAERSQAKKYALELFSSKKQQPSPAVKKTKPIQRSKALESVVRDLKDRKPEAAIKKLAPMIIESRGIETLYISVAKAYGKMSKEDRENTLLMGGSAEETRKLKSYVRKELYELGELKKLAKVTFLERKSKGQKIEIGDVLVPSRAFSKLGLRKDVQYEVSGVESGRVVLKTPSGKEIIAASTEVSRDRLFKKKQNSIAEGDLIRFQGGRQSVAGQITEVTDKKVCIVLQDGQTKEISHRKPLPIEHAIVATPFKREGLNKEKVILVTNHKLGSKSLEQAVDRANRSIEIHTDNRKKLLQRFSWYESQQIKIARTRMEGVQQEVADLKASFDKSKSLSRGVELTQ